jgi:GT2 family glycosyltransferase
MVRSDGTGVAIVTVTHNSRADLVRLLETVERHMPGAGMVVVDSGSSDGGPEAARAWRGGATVIELGENVGFGRATNRGVAATEEPVTVVANPDIELIDGSLAALAAEAVRPGAPERILAPLVLLPDGSRQDNVQRAPASAAMALAALIPPAALPQPLRTAVDPWRGDRAQRVSWAVGCCLVAPTDTLRRLGPFDERIFLYAEDTDLGLRAAQQGVQTWFWPDARVVHRRAHSTDAAFGGENVDLLARQRRAVVQERLGTRRRQLDDAIQLVTFTDRIALKALARRPHGRERAQLAALRRARRQPPRLA